MTATRITASRIIDAPSDVIFTVLSNPEKHAEIDGSGMVQSEEMTDRITAVGQVFTMNMSWDKLGGDYRTDNHVVGFDENKLLAWKTADSGQALAGWEWIWKLEPQGPDSANVSVTYDWSVVTDQAVLKKISFPVVEQEPLGNLAAAVSRA